MIWMRLDFHFRQALAVHFRTPLSISEHSNFVIKREISKFILKNNFFVEVFAGVAGIPIAFSWNMRNRSFQDSRDEFEDNQWISE